MSFWEVLGLLISLALADSVNPCTIYLYTTLLVSSALASARTGARRVAQVAIGFTGAVYIGYTFLGLGLLNILTEIPREVLSIIAISFGVYTIISGLKEKSRIIGKSYVFSLLRRARISIVMATALGFLATFTLLPCSAGPYIVFLGIVSKERFFVSIVLLLLYNLIFISPLIAVTLIATSMVRIRKIRKTIIEKNASISIVSGALLCCVGVYVLFY